MFNMGSLSTTINMGSLTITELVVESDYSVVESAYSSADSTTNLVKTSLWIRALRLNYGG